MNNTGPLTTPQTTAALSHPSGTQSAASAQFLVVGWFLVTDCAAADPRKPPEWGCPWQRALASVSLHCGNVAAGAGPPGVPATQL